MAAGQSGIRRRHTGGTFASYATTTLLLISLGLNLAQARKLRVFTAPPPIAPAIGTVLAPLMVTTLDGRPTTIDLSRPTIFYYFSPKCVWCERNWLNVKALVAATSHRYRFVGLSTSPDVRDYLASHQLLVEVYTGVDAERARVYNFGGTPRTIVVAAGGAVEHVWDGAYVGQQLADVERAFGIVLPGASQRSAPVNQP